MSALRVPCGTRQTCRFGFVARELTQQELEHFEAGGGLPDGVGVDPPIVLLEFQQPNDSQEKSLTGGAVTNVGMGEYEAELPIPMDAAGTWQWRGRGEQEDGAPFSCTPPQTFEAYRTF